MILLTSSIVLAGLQVQQAPGYSAKLDLVAVPAGSFVMGASDDVDPAEEPARSVQITRPFWIGRTEVTQRQYEAITSENPSRFKTPTRPVERVSWEDAGEFCRELTRLEEAAKSLPDGYVYRLPTEAEWEYCCRAGTTSPYYFGDDLTAIREHEWTRDNSGDATAEVAVKKPNAWGLHDMSGNVREWCLDWYGSYSEKRQVDPLGPPTGSKKVYRGGDWFYLADSGMCRATHRFGHVPSYANYHVGFRVVLAPSVEQLREGAAQRRREIEELFVRLLDENPDQRHRAREEIDRREAHDALPPNLARLDETQPGASRAVQWRSDGKWIAAPGLTDGDAAPLDTDKSTTALGVQWPVRHVFDRVVLHVAQRRGPTAFRLDAHNGQTWSPIERKVQIHAPPERGFVEFRFDPVASDAIRVRLQGEPCPFREIEVYAFASSEVPSIEWPASLVEDNLFEAQVLAEAPEPSFERLAEVALSTPSNALMGIKDARYEQVVSPSGAVLVHGVGQLSFNVGEPPRSLADAMDTVQRSLIDGWLPGVVLKGRIGPWAIEQTSLVTHADRDQEQPALFMRLELTNTTRRTQRTVLGCRIEPSTKSVYVFEDGILKDRGRPVLVVRSGSPAAALREGSLEFALESGAGRTVGIEWAVPLGRAPSTTDLEQIQGASFQSLTKRFRAAWTRLLQPCMQIDVPEPRLVALYRSVLTQILINAHGDFMPYGAYPSQYDGARYGAEEGYAMLALALYGLEDDAQRYLSATYLQDEFLEKVDRYREYRDRAQQVLNGAVPHTAIEAYRISRDRKWITGHMELIEQCAQWTIEHRGRNKKQDGEETLHHGLLPKWSFGGDVADLQCYSVRNNLVCWRGLSDTAWLLEDLGKDKKARALSREAVQYRAVIDSVLDKIYRKDSEPPFLPLRVYGTEPAAGDYFQLIAGLLLDLFPFDLQADRIGWIQEYLARSNRTFCFMPRFRRDVGAGGIDGVYSMGSILSLLHQGRVREFLLGFYGFQVFNMEHTCFTSRETNALFASDEHRRRPFPVPDRSDPNPCSSSVVLHLLRHALVTEEREGAGHYSGRLRLLAGAPRAWLKDGEVIDVRSAPTHFGKLSFRVESAVAKGRVSAVVNPPQRNRCEGIQLRLPHPQGLAIERVTVDGREWTQFDADASIVTLPGRRKTKVVAWFAETDRP